MIVVSSISALTNLAAVGRFDLLAEFCRKLHIPDAVWDELNARGQS